jgi:hypothetical protein
MNLDIDFLINFFEKYTKNESDKSEIGEQEAAAAPAAAPSSPSSSSGGSSSSSVPKWADNYGIKRGKANMLGKAGEKWSTGLNRGLANQIW